MRLEELLRSWGEEELNQLNRRLGTLEKRLYRTYEPSLPPRAGFWARLERWLDNLGPHSHDEKKTLLRLAASLFYIGPSEFLELYRYAYHGPIARWLIDEEKLDVTASDVGEQLKAAVSSTWFCPISDSMRINSFYHVNQISTEGDYRPDWRSLANFGSESAIQQYCIANNIKRLVLLEDFVGGGSQMREAVLYAAKFSPYLRVLVVPLLVCPRGSDAGRALAARHASVKFEPVVVIPESAFVSVNAVPGENTLHTALRELAAATYDTVSGGAGIGPKPYHPLGFPAAQPTGGLLVMYSNTPDNTLPMIHHTSATWSPLFPRHSRV